ncbi:MAG: hypothetical protein AAGA48_05240 [Myxococcota bacterium]
MVQTHENQEEVQQLLDEARRRLRAFEDRVDYSRLLLRLRTASPAHPVLLARFLFGALAVVAALLGLGVLSLPFLNQELARELAVVESVIPYVPADVPALPAVCGLLAICMLIAWVMTTGAALAIGRESKMLPFEQKQHQALVNEITRLTAVQRIRSTPASARPRIATPAPATMRSLSPAPGGAYTPAPSRAKPIGADAGSLGFRRTPTPAGGTRPPNPQASGHRANTPSPVGRDYPYAGFRQAPSSSMPPTPPGEVRPPVVPVSPPSPRPIASPPPAPLSATPQMGARDLPAFDEAALDDAPPEKSLGLIDTSDTLPVADEGFDPTSPDLFAEPRPAPWELPPSGRETIGIDGSLASGGQWVPEAPSGLEAASLVPLLDLEDDLDGPDDIDVDQLAEVELDDDEDEAPGAARITEPTLPGIDPQTGPVPPSDGPVVYDPAALRSSPVRASPVQPEQVRRPAASSDATTVRGPVVSSDLVEFPTDEDEESAATVRQAVIEEVEAEAGAAEEAPITIDTLVDGVEAPKKAPVEDTASVEEIHQDGILARARAGGWASRSTPYGSAGRIRPSSAPSMKSPAQKPARSTRGGTPLGAPPQETGRVSRNPSPPRTKAAPDEKARNLAALARLEPLESESVDYDDDEVTVLGASAFPTGARETAEDRWIGEIVRRADALARHLPAQAQLAYSQEPHLPFTLVIARATPTVAVRAMMSFVEFIVSIPTPPRARIQLVQVSHLERSFHRNVQAALEPHFDRNVVVEPQAGRVEIQFTDPDPRWGRHPRLPA